MCIISFKYGIFNKCHLNDNLILIFPSRKKPQNCVGWESDLRVEKKLGKWNIPKVLLYWREKVVSKNNIQVGENFKLLFSITIDKYEFDFESQEKLNCK